MLSDQLNSRFCTSVISLLRDCNFLNEGTSAFYSTLVVAKEFIKSRSMVTIYMIEVRNYLLSTVYSKLSA